MNVRNIFVVGIIWGGLLSVESDRICAQEPVPTSSRVNLVIIQAIQASNPRSAAELMRAVNNLANIGEFELANEYLSQAVAANTPDSELAKLADQFGSPFFIRLSLKQSLQPQIEKYTQRVFAAANKQARDPQQLSKWVRGLADDAQDVRSTALNKLRDAGSYGAGSILSDLSDSNSTLDKQRLLAALQTFGPDARPILIAGLRSSDTNMRNHALRALRYARPAPGQDVIPDLLKWCFAEQVDGSLRTECDTIVKKSFGGMPNRADARDYLIEIIHELLAPHAEILNADIDGRANLWVWNKNRLEERTYPLAIAQLIRATQLAADLFAIDNQTSQPRLLFAATQLGTAKILGGIPRTLQLDSPAVAYVMADFSAAELETVLSFCLQHELPLSAMATAELLGHIGSESNLGYDASRSALASALRSSHRRVQFAAANAIVALKPSQPFAGAGDLVGVLRRFASSNGLRRVLIVHPIRGEADLLATAMPGLGFAADITTNGRQAMERLQQKSDYDLILVGDAVSSPKWSELVQQLRHQNQQTPICIMTQGINEFLAIDIAARDELMKIFPTPYDTESVRTLLSHVLPIATERLTSSERHHYARESLRMLAQLAENMDENPYIELSAAEPAIVSAMNNPRLSLPATKAAGLLGTPASQRALVGTAGDERQTNEVREAALASLNVAIERRGLLLTRPQLLAQYHRYDQALAAGTDDLAVLGQLLDSLERLSGYSTR